MKLLILVPLISASVYFDEESSGLQLEEGSADPCPTLVREFGFSPVPGRSTILGLSHDSYKCDFANFSDPRGVCTNLTWNGAGSSERRVGVACSEAAAIVEDKTELNDINFQMSFKIISFAGIMSRRPQSWKTRGGVEFPGDGKMYLPSSGARSGAESEAPVEESEAKYLIGHNPTGALEWGDAPAFLNPADWLGAFANYRLVHLPVIPGVAAVDAVAKTRQPILGPAKTRLLELLMGGVRFLQLRLRNALIGPSRILVVPADLNLEDALSEMVLFLAVHPTEFLILSLKFDYSTFGPLTALLQNKFIEYILPFTPDLRELTVNEMRGKLLIRVDSEKPLPTSDLLFHPSVLALCRNGCALTWAGKTGGRYLLDRCMENYVSGADWERLRGVALDYKHPIFGDGGQVKYFFTQWDTRWSARRVRPVGIVVLPKFDPNSLQKLLGYAELYRTGSYKHVTSGGIDYSKVSAGDNTPPLSEADEEVLVVKHDGREETV